MRTQTNECVKDDGKYSIPGLTVEDAMSGVVMVAPIALSRFVVVQLEKDALAGQELGPKSFNQRHLQSQVEAKTPVVVLSESQLPESILRDVCEHR